MLNRIRNVRKRWLAVAAAVALLSVGLVGGSAVAAGIAERDDDDRLRHANGSDGDWDDHDTRAALMVRVADILGVPPGDVEAAFKIALDEQAGSRFDERIDALVADETLTQAQGEVAKTWFGSRPRSSGHVAIHLAHTADADRADAWLSRLVEDDMLTQDEADSLSAWHDDRPDHLPEGRDGRHGGHHDHGDDGDDDGA